MASKKKTKKKQTTASIIAVLVVIAILALGLLITPSIPALEGKVYHVDVKTSQNNVTITEGDALNLNYEASFDYLGVFNANLKDSVEVKYFDAAGNEVNGISAAGTYHVTYTVTYRGTTKTEEVVVTVKPKATGTGQGGEGQGGTGQGGEGQGGTGEGGEGQGGTGQGGEGQGGEGLAGAANLSIHFIDPTSAYPYAGDAIYIKAGDTDILIDAGPRQGSAGIIENYINQYCTDGTLEYVIATHADQDHIAGFVGTNSAPSIFEYYTCEVFIDFNLSDKPLTTNKGNPTLYANYITKRDAAVENGMKHYTALDCWNETNGAQKTYEIAEGITLNILYNYFYDHKSSDENNYSVCVLITETANNKNFYFLGDLEEKGEEYLVQYNTLPEADLFKAGHHGSPTSSNEVLLEVIKPKMTVFTCAAGNDEYTPDIDRIFPSTFAINRLAKYTDKMYCTGVMRNGQYEALNGNIVVSCINGEISVNCSNNNTLLKDSWWFNSDVDYYKKNTASYGLCDYLPDNKNPKEDTRKWRTWPE
ncbi:MAG: MBL fold metallo-hydrolase [Bacilli bacterium]|nr:MBL fold metallo-hydrolase [Bacilli bacterium]